LIIVANVVDINLSGEEMVLLRRNSELKFLPLKFEFLKLCPEKRKIMINYNFCDGYFNASRIALDMH